MNATSIPDHTVERRIMLKEGEEFAVRPIRASDKHSECAHCQINYQRDATIKAWKKRNRVKTNVNYPFEYCYGISKPDFELELECQDGLCAHCRAEIKKPYYACIGHCNNTKTIRGILCWHCHSAIEQLAEHDDIVLHAWTYFIFREPKN